MKRHWFMLLLLILAITSLSANAISAQEPVTADPLVPRDMHSGLVFSEQAPPLSEQQATTAYWTRERNLALPPAPLMVDSTASKAVSSVPDVDHVNASRQGFSPPGNSVSNADAIARATYPEAWLDEVVESSDGSDNYPSASDGLLGTSQVFTGYVLDYSALQRLTPHKWVGRFVSSTHGGCSGTAISNNHVVTAAHCVYDTSANRWHANKAFQPAYRNGNAPYGTFPTAGCSILTAWANLSGGYRIGSWAKVDVAVCDVGKNSSGYTLSQMVGWAGREWNAPYVRHFYELGYPAENYLGNLVWMGGRYLYACVGESATYATDVRRVGCDMGGGMSGGPSLRGYAINRSSGWVSGVTSGRDGSTQNLYSLRFTSNNIVPLCNARKC